MNPRTIANGILRAFFVLAGIQWKIFIDAMELARETIPEAQFLELRYEDLCDDPEGVFRKTLEFCELPESAVFSKRLATFSLSGQDEKWMRHLSGGQQRILEEVLASHLGRFGYGSIAAG